MRKPISLVMLFGTIISLSIGFIIVQAPQAPGWQIKLNNYLKSNNDALAKDPLLSRTVTVERMMRASRPENFHEPGNKVVFGDYYWLLEHKENVLPPPAEVMCVLVREETQPNDGCQVKTTFQVTR